MGGLGSVVPSVYVNVNVKSADGSVDSFKMQRQCPLSALEDAYCFKTRARQGSVQLRLNGTPLALTQSPEDLSLKDGALIDVVLKL